MRQQNSIETLSGFIEASRAFDQHKRDTIASSKDLSFFADKIAVGGVAYDYSLNATRQLLNRFSPDLSEFEHPERYFRKARGRKTPLKEPNIAKFVHMNRHNVIASTVLQTKLDEYRTSAFFKNEPLENDWFLRFYDEPDTSIPEQRNPTLRAALSDKYVPVANTFALEQTGLMIANGQLGNCDTADGTRMSSLDTFITPDRLVAKILLSQYDADGLGIGIAVCNDEAGSRSLSVYGFVKRSWCDNSIISSGCIRFYHKSFVLEKFMAILPQVQQQLVEAQQMREDFKKCQKKVLRRFDLIIPKFTKTTGQSEKFAQQMFIGSELDGNTDGTVAAFINAITHAAKILPDNERIQMEQLAGDFLQFNVADIYEYVGVPVR